MPKPRPPSWCKYCHVYLSGTFGYTNHVMQHHVAIDSTNNKFMQCKLCSYGCSRPDALLTHMKTHFQHKTSVRKCAQCDQTFNNLQQHTQHINEVHPTPATLPCNTCDKFFRTKAGLNAHQKTHRTAKLACPHCDKLFRETSHLEKHIRIHRGEEPYKCPLCPHWANTRQELARHHKSHHTTEGIQRHKREEQRVETALIKHGFTKFNSTDGTLPPPMSFTREHTIDFTCVEIPAAQGEHRAFIDFVISLPKGGICFLEVDEHQHKRGYNADMSCDMKRMSRVEESRTLEHLQLHPDVSTLPRSIWLRYNPHNYKIDNQIAPPSTKTEREEQLCQYLIGVDTTAECKSSHMCIRYLRYDIINSIPFCTLHPEYHPAYKPLAKSILSTPSTPKTT